MSKWHSLGNWIDEEGEQHQGGKAVATSRDGSTIAISAPYYDSDKGARAGRVVVYTFNDDDNTWKKYGEDIIGEPGDELGTSLAMAENGKALVIGMVSMKQTDEGAVKTDAGKVQVYRLNRKTEWEKKGQALTGDQALEQFGASVDISYEGDSIVVGSPGYDTDVKTRVGAVHVFSYDEDSREWKKVEGTIEGENQNDQFGFSVSLSEESQIAIGAPMANDAKGYVQMIKYIKLNKVWVKNGKIEWGNEGDKCGRSVSVSFDGESVAAGCPFHEGNGKRKRSGAVVVYKFDQTEEKWKPIGKSLVGRNTGDEFGTAVSMSDDGTEVAIGSPYSGEKDKESGHITVYHLAGDWMKMGLEVDGKYSFNHLGSSIGISGDGTQVIAGAPTEGYATVYTFTDEPPVTPSPEEEKEGGNSALGNFVRFMFYALFIGAIVFGLLKCVEFYRNRRAMAQFEVAATHDLEMRRQQQRPEWLAEQQQP